MDKTLADELLRKMSVVDREELFSYLQTIISQLNQEQLMNVYALLKSTSFPKIEIDLGESIANQVVVQRMSEQYVSECLEELEAELFLIENQEVSLEAYEDREYYDYWEDCGWTYNDPHEIGLTITKCVHFAKDCIDDRRYKQASSLLDRVLEIDVLADCEWDAFGVEIVDLVAENIAKIDLNQTCLLALYAQYQICPKDIRAEKLYCYFRSHAFDKIRIEEIFRVGREILPEQDYFWESWIELLLSKARKRIQIC